MSINKVENSKSNNYVLPALLGGTAGYSLKYIMPLSEFEHKDAFTKEVQKRSDEAALHARTMEYDKIISDSKIEGANIDKDVLRAFKDKSIKDSLLSNNADGFKKQVADFDDKVKAGLKNLAQSVFDKGEFAAKQIADETTVLAKNSRPGLYYATVGSIVALTIASLKQAFIHEAEYLKYEDTKLDYLV